MIHIVYEKRSLEKKINRYTVKVHVIFEKPQSDIFVFRWGNLKGHSPDERTCKSKAGLIFEKKTNKQTKTKTKNLRYI